MYILTILIGFMSCNKETSPEPKPQVVVTAVDDTEQNSGGGDVDSLVIAFIGEFDFLHTTSFDVKFTIDDVDTTVTLNLDNQFINIGSVAVNENNFEVALGFVKPKGFECGVNIQFELSHNQTKTLNLDKIVIYTKDVDTELKLFNIIDFEIIGLELLPEESLSRDISCP